MELLKCGCKIVDGDFVSGDKCRKNECFECTVLLPKIHPFGTKRIEDRGINNKD